MDEDLLFHIAPKDQWHSQQRYGLYRPDLREGEGFIHCSTASQVKKVADTKFAGQKNLYLIVIDRNLIISPVKMKDTSGEEEPFPHIYGPLNLDAVLDKIRLDPTEEGTFDIEFDSN